MSLATPVEIDYWCRRLLGVPVWRTFMDDISTGAYRLVDLDSRGYRRAAELEEQYADLQLGLVDAAVIVTCELLSEDKVATFDPRHFSVVRHGDRVVRLSGRMTCTFMAARPDN